MHHLQSHSLLGGDGTPLVNGLANDVHDPAQGLWAHWNSDGGSRVQNLLSTNQTLSTVHGNGTHRVLPCTEPSFLLNIQAGFISTMAQKRGWASSHQDAGRLPGLAWTHGPTPPGR